MRAAFGTPERKPLIARAVINEREYRPAMLTAMFGETAGGRGHFFRFFLRAGKRLNCAFVIVLAISLASLG